MCMYLPPSSPFLLSSHREEEESSGEEASSEEEQEAMAMDQGNGPAVITAAQLAATPTTSTASSVSDRDTGKGRTQEAADIRCGQNHLWNQRQGGGGMVYRSLEF